MNEWYGVLPLRWKTTRIKNIFALRDERNCAPMDEVRLISLYTHLGVVPHDQLEKTTGNRATTVENYKIVHEGDIIVNIILCWQGAIGLSKWSGVTSPAYDIYRPNADIYGRYYHYLFRLQQFSGECYRYGHGIMAMRWRTYADEFSAITVPLPSGDEQELIVRYLDWKVSGINRLINAKKKQVGLLKEQKRAVINATVTRGGEKWKQRRLKTLVTDTNEKDSPKDKFYIGMENIVSWTGSYIDTGVVTESDSKRFKKGDVLFGKLRPYLAKVYVPDVDGVCSGEFLVLRGFDGDLKFLKYYLLSYDFVMLVNASTYGAKMPRANWDFIGNCLIHLPPLPEQQAIVAELDDKCSQIDLLVKSTEQQITLLHEYRTRLISDVVTGKLDVRSVAVPEYEAVEETAESEDVEGEEELDEEAGDV